ncbi:MAG: hypothetical protein WAV93_07860 [Bacteroidales bacterium]
MAIYDAMRSIYVLLLLVLSLQAIAQEIRVKGVKMVMPEDNGTYLLSGVLPGSRWLLVAGEGYNGLSLLDTRKGKIRAITDGPGAGYEPAVTADGKKVFYRSDSFEDNRKYSSVYSFDITTGETQTLINRERGVQPPAVSGNTLFLKSDRETRFSRLPETVAVKSTGEDDFVVTEEMIPVLYRGGERKPLMPNGGGFYIWASLSPDGSMILYNYQGRNTWICDTSGKILHDVGKVNAPRWLDNRIVIGMDDRDDGHMITSSELVYYSLPEKKRRVLTDTENRSEMFPYPFGAGKIAFSTEKGEIYVMKIRIR